MPDMRPKLAKGSNPFDQELFDRMKLTLAGEYPYQPAYIEASTLLSVVLGRMTFFTVSRLA